MLTNKIAGCPVFFLSESQIHQMTPQEFKRHTHIFIRNVNNKNIKNPAIDIGAFTSVLSNHDKNGLRDTVDKLFFFFQLHDFLSSDKGGLDVTYAVATSNEYYFAEINKKNLICKEWIEIVEYILFNDITNASFKILMDLQYFFQCFYFSQGEPMCCYKRIYE